MTDLHYLSATEALRRFRARELSPVELLDAVIARAERVEPVVNALCETTYETARLEAREAEARYGGRGEAPRPLEGLPVAIKEEEAIAGRRHTLGSRLLADAVADHTSPLVERILRAGGICHARTTTPEFCCAGFTHTALWGVTRNPWNPEYASGGSSGGAGAALASGSTLLATGSDIAGSIRIPASFNGVVGFKPPYGRVPVDPPGNLDSYVHCGPLARTVADAALLQNVIAGPHPADAVSLRPKLALPGTDGDVGGLRIALSVDFGDWAVDPEVRANTQAVAAALRAAGATVEAVELPISATDMRRAATIHFRDSFAAEVGAAAAAHPEATEAYSRAFVEWTRQHAGDAGAPEGQAIEAALYAPVGALLERYDALLCPTVATRGLVAGEDYLPGAVLEIDGRRVEHYFDGMMTLPFNLMSRLPVLSVPSGVADNGVPTGVQIVGRSYDDPMVFRIGAAVERARPWLHDAAHRPTGWAAP